MRNREKRAEQAALWVEKEIDKLIAEIESIGRKSGNQIEITFGELFNHYQDVSDTLVGILQRAKKRGIVKYEGMGGDLLLQRKHDHVVITLDHAKGTAWRKEYRANGGTPAQATATKPAATRHVEPPKPVQAQPKAPTVVSQTANKPLARSAAPPTVSKATTPKVQTVKFKDLPLKKANGTTVAATPNNEKIASPIIYGLAITVVVVVLFLIRSFLRMIF